MGSVTDRLRPATGYRQHCPTISSAWNKPVKVKILFSYYENVTPPRCRKPRPVRFDDGEVLIEIKDVAPEDAPIALRGQGVLLRAPDMHYTLQYRWWGGQLWSALRLDADGVTPRPHTYGREDWAYPAWPEELDLRGDARQLFRNPYDLQAALTDRRSIETYLQEAARSHIQIDGRAYRPAGEPRYVVMTFGLGHDHGGTACLTADCFNGNIDIRRYFNLLERDKAIELASTLARERGDLKSLPIEPHGPVWEIHLPEAIRVPYTASTPLMEALS